MTTLRALSDDIEVYSIDEAFLNIHSETDDYAGLARYMAAKVRRDTGIPVSIGFAPTRTLAKIASRFAKKYPGYAGGCVIDTPEKTAKALTLTPVGDVWGIGRRLLKRLKIYGINTAMDLASLPQERIESIFNITGVRTWKELNGIPSIVPDNDSEHKTITSSRSFAKEVYTFEELHKAFAVFATIAAKKLREQKEHALEVEAFIATNRFRDNAPLYFNSCSVTLAESSDSTSEILKAALKGSEKDIPSGTRLQKSRHYNIPHSPLPSTSYFFRHSQNGKDVKTDAHCRCNQQQSALQLRCKNRIYGKRTGRNITQRPFFKTVYNTPGRHYRGTCLKPCVSLPYGETPETVSVQGRQMTGVWSVPRDAPPKCLRFPPKPLWQKRLLPAIFPTHCDDGDRALSAHYGHD